MGLVWYRRSHNLFLKSLLPRLVIYSNHMEGLFMPPAWQTYTKLLFATIVNMSRAFVQGKLTWVGLSIVSLDWFFSWPSRSCQYLVISHHIFGPLIMPVWEGLHWHISGGFVSYWLWHIALRVNLELHPGPIYIIDRWPCTQHLIIIMGLWLSGFPCVRHQLTLSHLGFVQYLDFHLTLSVGI